jgi:hypothetical protein
MSQIGPTQFIGDKKQESEIVMISKSEFFYVEESTPTC